jgi:hypothetical protein
MLETLHGMAWLQGGIAAKQAAKLRWNSSFAQCSQLLQKTQQLES